jgi:hypothetical protein
MSNIDKYHGAPGRLDRAHRRQLDQWSQGKQLANAAEARRQEVVAMRLHGGANLVHQVDGHLMAMGALEDRLWAISPNTAKRVSHVIDGYTFGASRSIASYMAGES